MYKPFKCDVCEGNAQSSARKGQKYGFDDAFANELCPASTERGAYCKLFTTRGGARHQQVGDIETGNQKEASGGSEKRVQRSFYIVGFCLEQGANIRGIEDRALRKLFSDLRRDIAQISLSCTQRHAWLQLPYYVEVVRIVPFHHFLRRFRIERRPHLDTRIRIHEPCGKNSDYRIGLG